MNRKLIVAGIFFVAGLLTTAMVTLGLLMSLMKIPAPLSTASITAALKKSLGTLEEDNAPRGRYGANHSAVKLFPLSGAIIDKAKQKGLRVAPGPTLSVTSREYKPFFTQSLLKTERGMPQPSARRPKTQPESPRPARQDELIRELLYRQWTSSDEKTKREIATKLLKSQQPDGGWSAFPGRPADPCLTAQALYSLQESGMLSPDAPASQKALAFLIGSQQVDGGWSGAADATQDGISAGPVAIDAEDLVNETETTNWVSLALLESLPDKK